ncbi:MAG: cobalt-factor II C(20)-methyltransferase [Archaeoglobaceae archaeon]|nr:cobalt-factor II C(20)-methyltransferase [Archaeoglobaceae archaeon]MCX8152497.1 cobalt-factor II C(20)-methyltransferase [Archaeoglobaceae archaeon]MDW8013688.1 cobalt-factor II C(20)-methyltransferase [Archaeoglobaceae archaeon]
MLIGVSLGPGDPELLTLKAIKIIKDADEVIVPGEMAAKIVRIYREPRIVEFPMKDGKKVAKELAKEISQREKDLIAFCCLGDVSLYSTFSLLTEEVLKINPKIEIKVIPGVSSVSAALAATKIFIKKSLLITTNFEEEVVAVMKAKKSAEVAEKLRTIGYSKILLVERLFMNGERICSEIPEEADYFSIILGVKE